MIKLSEMFNQMQVYSNPQATPFKPKVDLQKLLEEN